MTMPIQDVSYPSPFSYHLPESLADACGLGQDLQYLKEFDPNNMFIDEHVLRHILDLQSDPYSDGNCDYNEDCRFLNSLECPAQVYARASYCARPSHEWLIDGGGAMIRSKWGSFRYFLLFVCAKTNYTVIYYLKDNSAHQLLIG